ncbi:GNAT family N-acetyltransferase [Brevibacillus sedimenti]|jgi:hypothetical protein|uniref:GNAT family N-acetyltransferase n=1 Tax=Brevibacillus sedimenti TaxID=2613334 RepID=UPI001E4D3728|nr:GNAT family N-acetyltransferase [Anoxybacillus sediminis]UFJ61895.1 hypothetical protein IRT44_03405 [Anoxybacillus sediminis]
MDLQTLSQNIFSKGGGQLIKGERVELRPVTEADLVRQFEWRYDEEVAKWAVGSEAVEYSNLLLESLRAMYAEAVRSTLPSDNLRGYVFSVYTLDGVHIGIFFGKRKRPARSTETNDRIDRSDRRRTWWMR